MLVLVGTTPGTGTRVKTLSAVTVAGAWSVAVCNPCCARPVTTSPFVVQKLSVALLQTLVANLAGDRIKGYIRVQW